MNYKILGENKDIVFIDTEELVITDTQSALDFLMAIRYEINCSKIILNKNSLPKEFFILSSGMAGEILQKFINYKFKAAIIGDFSVYTSKPLKDFIYESNKGKDIFFLKSLDEAEQRLQDL